MSSTSLISTSGTTPVAGEIPPNNKTPVQPDDSGSVPIWRSAVILFIALLAGFACLFNPPLDLSPQAGVVMDLPVFVGDYLGKKGEITQIELGLLPKDTEFARRNYDDGKGDQITCSIVLSGAEQRSIHRPEGCLTGQGWTITSQDYIPIPLKSGHKLTARKLSLSREVTTPDGGSLTVRAFYIYWFVGQNVSTPSEMERVLLSNWDRVMHNIAHRWAYVSVFSIVSDNLRPDGLDPEQTTAKMVDFAAQIVPTFQISEMPQQAKN